MMGDQVNNNPSVFKLLDGEVYAWVEPEEGIYLKAVNPISRAPVELTSTTARQLAAMLLEMAGRLAVC